MKPLPDLFLLEIGRLVDAFGQMELEFEVIFAGLIHENQDIGRVLWSLLGGFDSRMNALLSVYAARFGVADEYFVKLRALVEEANSLAAKRHKVIHSAYRLGVNNSIRRMRTLRAKKAFRVDLEDNLTPEDIRAVVEAVITFWREQRVFTDALLSAGRTYEFLLDEEDSK